MAIIIPSKNIYDKNHNKIRDNVIDNVEVDGTEVVPDNHYDEAVYTTNFPAENEVLGEWVEKTSGFNFSSGNNRYFAFVASGYRMASQSITITVPRVKKTSYINEIFVGKDENGNANIQYNAECYLYEGTVTGDGTVGVGNGYPSSFVNGRVIEYPTFPDQKKLVKGQLPKETSVEEKDKSYGTQIASVSLNIDYKSNLSSEEALVRATDDYYYFSLIVPCAVELYTATTGSLQGFGLGNTYPANGEAKLYVPISVEITFYGNTIGIDLVDKTVKIGSGNHPFSIGGNNELLQTSNYLNTVDYKAIERSYGDTLNKYSNGKETATLLCSISDYYDESGNKVIAIDNSTNKMAFRLYDEVIPYVFGADGKDKPLSKNKDGSAKHFQVLGVAPFYDGAVWQELTLQEV